MKNPSSFIKLFSSLMASALLFFLPHTVAATDLKTLKQTTRNTPAIDKALTWGGTEDDIGIATAVDGSGNIYVTGYFHGLVDFNPGSGINNLQAIGGRDVFLSKFDANRNFLWAKTWGGSGDERGESVVVDNSGNVYVSGPFQNTVDFNPAGGASHTSNAGTANNIYLSKFSTDGTFQWVKTWGPSDGGAESYSITIDRLNNIYVVGDFSGSICDFNPWGSHDWHSNHPAGSLGRLFDAYLSKFDSNGNFLWAKTWGGEGYDDGPGVAVDSLGNIYVGGMYASQTINFDPDGGANGLDHSASNSGIVVDVFLSKFSSDGTFQWVKTWGGVGVDDVGQIVTVDAADNIYLGGRFGCINCDFDTGAGVNLHSSNGDLDAFVSKFSSDGTFQWAKSWGGSGWDAVGGLTTDSSNNVYIGGPFKNTVDFGSGNSVSANGTMWDAYLSKFDTFGTFQWAQTWGGSGNDINNKLTSDTAGNIYSSGWFTGTVDFAPGNGGDIHTSTGVGGDTFLLIFNDHSTPTTNTIAGNVGVAEAVLSYTDGTAKTTIADSNGNYTITVSYNWSGTVIPSKINYIFSPTQKVYSNNKINLSNENYLASTAKPDLIITNVTFNPVSPGKNQTFNVSITIKNQGGTGSAGTIYRDVYIDRDPSTLLDPITGCPSPGDFFRSDSYASIPANMSDTKTVTITGGLPAGSHQIWVYVDARCLIDESSGSNNTP